ncbi:hypothetical protein AAG906_020176 [Vitis piasezkii]
MSSRDRVWCLENGRVGAVWGKGGSGAVWEGGGRSEEAEESGVSARGNGENQRRCRERWRSGSVLRILSGRCRRWNRVVPQDGTIRAVWEGGWSRLWCLQDGGDGRQVLGRRVEIRGQENAEVLESGESGVHAQKMVRSGVSLGKVRSGAVLNAVGRCRKWKNRCGCLKMVRSGLGKGEIGWDLGKRSGRGSEGGDECG